MNNFLKSVYIPILVFGYVISSSFSAFFNLSNTIINGGLRALTLSIAIFLIIRNFSHIQKSGLSVILILCFALLYIIHGLVDSYSGDLEMGLLNFLQKFLIICLIPSIAVLFIEREYILQPKYVLLAAGLSSILIMYGLAKNSSSASSQFRATGNEYLNPISTGLYATIVMGLFLSFKSTGIFSNIIKSVMIVLSIFIVFASASRGPFLAMACMIIFYSIFYLKSRISYLIAIIPMLLYFFYDKIANTLMSTSIFNRLSQSGDIEQDIRYNLLQASYNQFLTSPIIGSFVELKGFDAYPHNVILESFMTTGILGGLIFAALWLKSLMFSLSSAGKKDVKHIPMIILPTLILSLSSGSLYNSSLLWISICIVASLNQSNRKNKMVAA